VGDEWWTAFSGRSNINYNLSCCHSPDPDVLVDRCLNPTLQIGKPALIMLSGPGLVTAQKLVESRWVTVGALPLMALPDPVGFDTDRSGVERLDRGQLGSARQMLAECYGLDLASAETAFPDAVADRPDMAAWDCSPRVGWSRVSPRSDRTAWSWCGRWRPDRTARSGATVAGCSRQS